MWEAIDLREIRAFLTLAEELHFKRTADRLGLTQSRVSQSIRSLEQKLGSELVYRTSRRVELTAAGERFLAEVRAAHDQLVDVLRRADRSTRTPTRTLTLGLLTAASGGPLMVAIIDCFEARHPAFEVQVTELPFRDRLEPLRRGEIDVLVARLPLNQVDLVVGPTLSRDERVLAVSRDHPLAGAAKVTIEDIADHEVTEIDGLLPSELAAAFSPLTTPGGRRIRRCRVRPRDVNELVMLIARGRAIHPTVPAFLTSFGHPGIVGVPIANLPPSESALVWLRRNPDPMVTEFGRTASAVLEASQPARRSGLSEA
ncbi:MAG: LysR family transcriptional regulator [Solirubrobacteraceae bacterium]